MFISVFWGRATRVMAWTFAAYMSAFPLNSRVLILEEILSVKSNANQRDVKVKKGSLRFSRAMAVQPLS